MTRELEAVLAQLRPASPRHLLDDLARIGATLVAHDRGRPEVELYLASGQILRGRLVSVIDHAVVVHTGGSARAPAVACVRVDQVAAVVVGDAGVLAQPLRSDAPVPSKLALQRECAARADGLAAALGHPIAIELRATELDDDGRRAIGLVVPLVGDVLQAIAADALGTEALAGVHALELGAATRLEVERAGSRLVIRAPTLLAEQPTRGALREAIERLL